MKVYGWRGVHKKQGRFICMAPSRAAIERLVDYRINPNNDCFCETGNKEEIQFAMENPPLHVFWRSSNPSIKEPFELVHPKMIARRIREGMEE